MRRRLAIKYYDILLSLALEIREERSLFASRRRRRCTLEAELAHSRENSSATTTANSRARDCLDKM